jgi:uncharacterized protein (DUF1501 family)
MNRRQALQWLSGGLALAAVPRWLCAERASDEFFVFIHASGGWDVTLWADPRNTRQGLVEPATVTNTEIGGLVHWRTAGDSFAPLVAGSGGFELGPAIGGLWNLRDRITVINGIAMNTVSHDDGTTFAITGRHRTGGTLSESSVDVLIASELGVTQLMPAVSIRFPSAFVGSRPDRRAVPLRVGAVESIAKSFARSSVALGSPDRAEISAVLTDEARDLSARSTHPVVYEQLASQQRALPALLTGEVASSLTAEALRKAYPRFANNGPQAQNILSAAFAVEVLKRNLVRSIAFSIGGLDTHGANHRRHALQLQELFDTVATLIDVLDATRHPTRPNARLSEHTHVLVVSEFCRTPQINPSGGRDHYPNNSALVISPRFRAGRVFGATDLEQLLPVAPKQLTNGSLLSPPDILATFLGAFGIDPRRYMRDGQILGAMLA